MTAHVTTPEPLCAKYDNLISNYNNELAALRLIARGVSPKIMQGVRAKNSDVASDEQRAANLLNFHSDLRADGSICLRSRPCHR